MKFIGIMKPDVLIPIHFVSFADTAAFREKAGRAGTQVLEVRHNGERLV